MGLEHCPKEISTAFPVLFYFRAEVLHILDDGWMGAEHGKGNVGLEKGRLTLVKSIEHFRGVRRIA